MALIRQSYGKNLAAKSVSTWQHSAAEWCCRGSDLLVIRQRFVSNSSIKIFRGYKIPDFCISHIQAARTLLYASYGLGRCIVAAECRGKQCQLYHCRWNVLVIKTSTMLVCYVVLTVRVLQSNVVASFLPLI